MALPSISKAFPSASASPSSPAVAFASAMAAAKTSISPRACGRGRHAPGNCKQPRPSRLVFDFSEEYLAQFFHLPQKDAAKLIGVAVITVKRVCKRLGINWPYRAEKLRRLREQRALRRLAAVHHRHSGVCRRPRASRPGVKQFKELSEAAKRFARLPVECMEENEGEDDNGSGRDEEDVDVDAEAILRSLALADARSYPARSDARAL